MLMTESFTDLFRNSISNFLVEYPQITHKWLEGSDGFKTSLYIPKKTDRGFDIAIKVSDDGVRPYVEKLYIPPPGEFQKEDIEWVKRFILSAVSTESILAIESVGDKIQSRTFFYFDNDTQNMWIRREKYYWFFPKISNEVRLQNNIIERP